MRLDRWTVKKLIRACEVAAFAEKAYALNAPGKKARAQAWRNKDHFEALEDQLRVALGQWKKNRILEL